MLRKTKRALLLAGVAALSLTGTAQARQIQQYFFNGHRFDAGEHAAGIAFDGVNNKILVVGTGGKEASQEEPLRITKYKPNGDSDEFSAREGAPSFHTERVFKTPPDVAIAVDESGTASAGNFYVTAREGRFAEGEVFGYSADGAELPGFPIPTPGACGVTVGADGNLWVASEALGGFAEVTPKGEATGRAIVPNVPVVVNQGSGCQIAIDSAGNYYVSVAERFFKYDSNLQLVEMIGRADPIDIGETTPELKFDDGTLFDLFSAEFSLSRIVQTDLEGNPITLFGEPDPAHFSYEGLKAGSSSRAGSLGIAVDPHTHDVYALSGDEVHVFSRDPSAITVPTVSATGVENLTSTSATLVGTVDPDGENTTDCRFEWGGPDAFGAFGGYDKSVPCEQGSVFAGGSGENTVSAQLAGLSKGNAYHFRVSAKNASGVPEVSSDREFRAADPPSVSSVSASHVTTDAARIALAVNTNGDDSSFHVEIGTDTSYGMNVPVPNVKIATAFLEPPQYETYILILTPQPETQEVKGLQPDTVYHYRVVAENSAGVTAGADHVFRTYALPSVGADPCPNAQARQQTSAAGLLDCRGYELVSATETGGYDVRSGLSAGVNPLSTSPQASDAALYSMRSGTIPGIAGHPTNRGADPYVATRGVNGWSTRYVGLASNNPFASGPFASPLSDFDRALGSFSFGGEEICEPCFEDGSTNVPLRVGNADIEEGMAGSLDPGPAEPAGVVKKTLSPDGSHFIFGTTTQLEPGANSNGADATLYSRDLKAKSTEVISTDASGDAIQNGQGVAELDVSKDGSRTVIGEKLATDGAGNAHYHLYLHIAGDPESVDLMPGATEGALFDGMTEDGTKVFFTSSEPLAPSESDTSADVYRDEVPGPGSIVPQVLSQGSGVGDTDACSPPGEPNSWNASSGEGKCSALAFAGGAGVASESGDFYFLSPELLDGPSNGTLDQANLYLVKAGTTTPHFVATIDSSLTKPPPAPATRPILPGSFGGSHQTLKAMTVDQSNGDVYVTEQSGGRLSRYTPAGLPDNFTEGPAANSNTIEGLTFIESAGAVAVDNSGGPMDGDIYVTNVNVSGVSIFSPTGKALGQLTGIAEICGVAVDQSDGSVYVSDCAGHSVKRFAPSSATPTPISNANYTVTGISTEFEPAAIAADDGDVYVSAWYQGPSKHFQASSFATGLPSVSGTPLDSRAAALATDPNTHEVYVDEEDKIVTFNAAGAQQMTLAAGKISESRGVAVNATSHHVYAATAGGASIMEIGYESTPYVPIDNPAILHAIKQAGTYDSSDFEVTPDGKYAAFASLLPLDGYDSGGHYEVFRYDSEGAGPSCVSCSYSLSLPDSDATLTPYGSSLTDDGRVFFTTGEQLTLRDTNEKRDAYEWENGKQELISTGTSADDSELLSVSSDGKNALFFTRQKLVPEDENGGNVRLYTAREDGGFEFGPPTFQCAASDECHGASTKAAPPLAAGTTAGTSSQFEEAKKPARCAKGKVRRKGKCVKRSAHKRHAHKRAAKNKRGGGK